MTMRLIVICALCMVGGCAQDRGMKRAKRADSPSLAEKRRQEREKAEERAEGYLFGREQEYVETQWDPQLGKYTLHSNRKY